MKFKDLPRSKVMIDINEKKGSLELWRHSLGDGGINNLPLPDRVAKGVKKLKSRLIRVFIQEYFNIYPDHGEYNWDILDKYMDSLAKTGAKIVASINIKPEVLYPEIDQSIWQPNNVKEWQEVISNLVKRYSIDRQIVTYWEIGNETDIGETGGCPYLIKDPEQYYEYYMMTIKPILEVFPEAKVGGPANAYIENEPLPGLIKLCAKNNTQLDFISWHLYNDDPKQHVSGIKKAKKLISNISGKKPELMITEWNVGFPEVSIEEIAFMPRRAANAAVIILDMLEANLDWSFYYHIWDQTLYREQLENYFAEVDEIMGQHWNEIPHRFGLFGVNEEVRPQYFVYQMLASMSDDRVASTTDEKDIRTLAAIGEDGVNVFMVNHNLQSSQDRIVELQFSSLNPGIKNIVVYRIDSRQRWSKEKLELLPVEERKVDVSDKFHCQVYLPADSVVLFKLENV